MKYEDGEEVVLWMNTVGPYHNRQETYSYFSLPFCEGPKKDISHYHETLSEALQGVELVFSGLDIDYKGQWQENITEDFWLTSDCQCSLFFSFAACVVHILIADAKKHPLGIY